ncbi:MAG TPA: dTMP kinase [Trueperaceae bacterium]|nr:dTMP kinase [Trueperaceae bacterium]
MARAAEAGPGCLIVFEGPEGAGKSTQVALVAARLREAGIAATVTREPGGTPTGDAIRELLLHAEVAIDPLVEFLLYSASRAQHVREVILPALERGEVVVSDRFAAASTAYQGYGRGLDLGFVADLSRRVTAGVRPDLTLLLDLDPVVGLERVAGRGARDRLERAGLDFHRRVREGFLAQAAEDASWLVLDAAQPPGRIAEQVWDAVRERCRPA